MPSYNTTWLSALAALGWAMTATAAPASAAATAQPKGSIGPALTVVHQFDDSFHLVGIGVSKQGRVFATAPTARKTKGVSMVEVDAKTGQLTPYPSADWNTVRDAPDGKPEWGLVQALWDDASDHLWALDTGVAAANNPIAPKLVEFDLATNQPLRTYTFEGTVSVADALNDVRVDVKNHAAYLTAAGSNGGIVVLDLDSGHSRLVLANDRSAVPAPGEHLMIGNQPALKLDGSQVVIKTDGVALSPDGRWLYYRPLNDHNYWRVETASLRDASLPAAALSRQVQFLGKGAMSGGLIMDRHGTLYAGDIEYATVVAFTIKHNAMQSLVFVKDPGELVWADGFAISGDDLYIADSHLNEVAFKNDLPRSGPFAIFKVKLPAS